MLILPLKPAVRADVQNSLGQWLDSDDQQVSFDPSNPLQFVMPKPAFGSQDCQADLLRLQSLRNCLSDTLLKPGSHKAALEEGAMADCLEYHAALLEFEKRGFPTVNDPHCHNGLTLAWKGAFDNAAAATSSLEKHATLLWDRAAVTYNIVALLTAQMADCSLADRAACKQAVGYCQQAAGILVVLRDFVSSQDFATVDLSAAMLHFWEAYLLAEGQTFVYRMAALAGDNAKHSTLAYLAQSAHALWNTALTKAQEPRLQSEVAAASKNWATYCKANSMLAASKAEYHMAVTHRMQHEWGPELARLRACLTKLEACHTFLQSAAGDDVVDYTRRECAAIRPVVQDRWTEADKDNYNIYNDQVPATVPEITPKQLIKNTGGYTPAMLTPQTPLFVGL